MRRINTLLITNQNFRARVSECEIHLVFGPPCVERHVDSANRDNGRKRHDPLREVTHGNSNTVAFFHAIFVHQYM